MTIPRREGGIDVTQAIAEAQVVNTGPLVAGGDRSKGSAARVKGSVWATNPMLFAYSNLMLAVPDELSSAATAVYCMVSPIVIDSW